ncbi:MAG: hypothetical protein ACK4K7_06800, partial [Allosphingosinicella sp.]|uniref:hypothetical protein n=1 Tax=Allosphingosinicella sp. TaxID=2823234 RepID=UPI003936016C
MSRDTSDLAEAAAAVIEAFRPQLHAGTLKPAQHATLLLLEQRLFPLQEPGEGQAGGGGGNTSPPATPHTNSATTPPTNRGVFRFP